MNGFDVLLVGVVMITLVGFFLDQWAAKTVRSVPAPQRKIVQRVSTEFGENVRLECGHVVSIVMHRVSELPCKECAEGSPKDAA